MLSPVGQMGSSCWTPSDSQSLCCVAIHLKLLQVPQTAGHFPTSTSVSFTICGCLNHFSSFTGEEQQIQAAPFSLVRSFLSSGPNGCFVYLSVLVLLVLLYYKLVTDNNKANPKKTILDLYLLYCLHTNRGKNPFKIKCYLCIMTACRW